MNVSALVIDFSRVLIFASAEVESLNLHHQELAAVAGYRVLDHFRLNNELLDYLRIFDAKWPVVLFTSGRLHALPEIAPRIEGIFKRIMTVEDLGYEKNQPEAYLALAYRIGRTPQELLFVDDQQRNLEAAKVAGYMTHQYSTNSELIKLLEAATLPPAQ
jgi:FMN phosphatase YigB (HAD superfamily)